MLGANAVLMDAYNTDVRPLLARGARGAGPGPRPDRRLRRSGYGEKIVAERVGGTPASWGRLKPRSTKELESSIPRRLIARSNRLGADPRNTNYAGGNTSAKGTATDPVTGADVELMWVKGSGGDLGTLTAAGLAVLRLDRLRALAGVYPGVEREDEMVAAFDYCLHGKGGAAPSIDTAMHGLVDAAHVDHLHPDAGIALAAAADGEALTKGLLRRPGGVGAVAAARLPARPGHRRGPARRNPAAIGVILGGHGITAWGATSAECEAQLAGDHRAPRSCSWTSTAAPEPFGPPSPATSRCPAPSGAPGPPRWPRCIRGLASTDRPQVGHFTDADAVLGLPGPGRHPRWPRSAPPARTISCARRSRPLVLDLPPDRPAGRGDRTGCASCTPPTATTTGPTTSGTPTPDSPPMRGADPAIVLVPGVGMFSYGADKQTARVAGEFYVNAINVMRGAESVSAYAADQRGGEVPDRVLGAGGGQAAAAARTPRPLASRVALVTGGGSGIGRATARRLAAEGACVVVADRDGDAARRGRGASARADVAVAFTSDVTDEDSVVGAFEAAALAFGGVDLVVNNAGLSISRPLLETTAADWDIQHDVMARGSFLVSREAARVMAAQGMGGDIIYICSKNSVFAGPDQRRLRRGQGRPGAPGPAAGRRARRARHPGQRHQPGRRRPRLRHLRRRLGRAAGRRLRRARGGTRRVLRPADAAQARGTARARGRRRGGADRGRPAADHRPAHPGRRRGGGGVPAMTAVTRGARRSPRDLGASGGRVWSGGSTAAGWSSRGAPVPERPVSAGGTLHWDILRLYRGRARRAAGGGPRRRRWTASASTPGAWTTGCSTSRGAAGQSGALPRRADDGGRATSWPASRPRSFTPSPASSSCRSTRSASSPRRPARRSWPRPHDCCSSPTCSATG